MKNKQKILIVDDIVANIKVLVGMLQNFCEISIATSGNDALNVVKKTNFDIILLDIMMPEMDGFEVCQKLKSDPETKNIPVIFISATNEQNSETKGFELGAVDYITKPFQPGVVIARVKTHLKLKLYQDHLEELVKERTNALLSTNTQLKQEIQKKIKTQNELKKAKQKAEVANEVKTQFIANMSHEFRTPLNAILGATDILLEIDLTENQQKCANIIKNSTYTFLSLVDNILDFSTIESGELPIKQKNFHLKKFLKEIQNSLSIKYCYKNIIISCLMDSKIPCMLYGDTKRIKQIIENILDNAMKFTNDGSVDIQVLHIDESQESVTICFKIIDTGIGISKDRLPYLFDSFSQGDISNTRRYGGMGLGLCLAKKLAELMNATIEVESEYKQGSIFSFTIVLKKQHLSIIDKSIDQTDSHFTNNKNLIFKIDCKQNDNIASNLTDNISNVISFNSKFQKDAFRVLLVEDNIMNQKLVTHFITSIDRYRVDIASNGLEAIKFLEQFNYDIVLMDIQMPIMDGLEATRVIRDKKSKVINHDVPVVAVTARVMKHDIWECIKVGMNDYIPKPVKKNILLRLLKKYS